MIIYLQMIERHPETELNEEVVGLTVEYEGTNGLPDEDTFHHVFSIQFKKKMKKLLWKEKHPIIYYSMKSAASYQCKIQYFMGSRGICFNT